MQLWMTLAAIALVLWLISLVRVGAAVDYDASGLLVTVRAGPVKLTVFPPGKKDKPPKPKKKAAKPAPEQPEKKGGNLALVQRFLPLAAEAAGRFRKKVRIDTIVLELVWGSPDPAMAALGYGWANAALGMLWPLIANNFTVRERQLGVSLDYGAARPVIILRAVLSLTLGQCAALGAALGLKFLMAYRSYRKEQKLKEAV